MDDILTIPFATEELDIQLTQFYHNIGMNTEHWTGWPTDDNSYVNEASWQRALARTSA